MRNMKNHRVFSKELSLTDGSIIGAQDGGLGKSFLTLNPKEQETFWKVRCPSTMGRAERQLTELPKVFSCEPILLYIPRPVDQDLRPTLLSTYLQIVPGFLHRQYRRWGYCPHVVCGCLLHRSLPMQAYRLYLG